MTDVLDPEARPNEALIAELSAPVATIDHLAEWRNAPIRVNSSGSTYASECPSCHANQFGVDLQQIRAWQLSHWCPTPNGHPAPSVGIGEGEPT